MSIFKVHDINLILFELLDIDDLRNLYQVNTYYRKSLYSTLCSFFIFYANIDNINPIEIKYGQLFHKSIVFGNLAICKYLYQKYNINISENGSEYAIICCVQGHFDILQWLDSIGVNMHKNYDVFRISCKYGHIEIVKYLQLLGANRYGSDYDYAFELACKCGHIKVAKYLYLKADNIDVFSNNLFEHACRHGNIKVAKWLYSISANFININYINDTFMTTCEHGHIEIVKWLYTIAVLTDDDCNTAFTIACQYGHIKIAKWLNYVCEFTDDDHKVAFTMACKHGHIEIVKWLYELNAFFVDDSNVIKGTLYDNVIVGNNKILLWILYFTFKKFLIIALSILLDYMTFNA